MELRQIRHFLSIAEHKNFHRAAEASNLTQPAISKSLRKLEEFLGVELLDRSNSGASLTPIGLSFLVNAKTILAEIDHAQDSVKALREGVKGEVIIGAAPSMTNHLIPMAIVNLAKNILGIRLKVVSELNDLLYDHLRNGELDLVLSAIPDPPHFDKELFHELLFFDRVNIVVRADHPILDFEIPSLEQLLNYPWVLFGSGVLSRERLKSIFLSASLQPPAPAVESNEATINKSLVLKSNFLSFLPCEAIRNEIRSGEIVRLKNPQSEWRRPVGFTFRSRGVPSPATILVAEEIRKLIALDYVNDVVT